MSKRLATGVVAGFPLQAVARAVAAEELDVLVYPELGMQPDTFALVAQGQAKKGDVIGIARIAAIQGAKRTADLVPLCHPLPITRVAVELALEPEAAQLRCTAQVETFGRTGVEMEALTAVQVGLLTVYDMCKAVDRGMVMDGIRLLRKSGGKSGEWVAQDAEGAAPAPG